MNIWFDKVFDCVFIFIGVFFAFFFNKCQQDKMLVEELRFNLSQIQGELPTEKPGEEVENFIFEQKKGEDGYCAIRTDSIYYKMYSGSKHLDVILNRGLGSYLDDADKPLLKQIFGFYDIFLARAQQSFEDHIELVDRASNTLFNTKKCMSQKDFEILRRSLKPSYMRYQKARVISEIIGYDIYKKLNEMGIEPYENQELKIEFNFSIKDWDKD